jgi:hypothetical protein
MGWKYENSCHLYCIQQGSFKVLRSFGAKLSTSTVTESNKYVNVKPICRNQELGAVNMRRLW